MITTKPRETRPRRLTQDTLAVRVRRARRIRAAELSVPGDLEPLARRNHLLVQTVWHATVEYTNALHS